VSVVRQGRLHNLERRFTFQRHRIEVNMTSDFSTAPPECTSPRQEEKVDKNHDSINSSFSEATSKTGTGQGVTCPWSRREMLTGRPDDYVGGYDPHFIYNFRREQTRGKPIKIEGYNK